MGLKPKAHWRFTSCKEETSKNRSRRCFDASSFFASKISKVWKMHPKRCMSLSYKRLLAFLVLALAAIFLGAHTQPLQALPAMSEVGVSSLESRCASRSYKNNHILSAVQYTTIYGCHDIQTSRMRCLLHPFASILPEEGSWIQTQKHS